MIAQKQEPKLTGHHRSAYPPSNQRSFSFFQYISSTSSAFGDKSRHQCVLTRCHSVLVSAVHPENIITVARTMCSATGHGDRQLGNALGRQRRRDFIRRSRKTFTQTALYSSAAVAGARRHYFYVHIGGGVDSPCRNIIKWIDLCFAKIREHVGSPGQWNDIPLADNIFFR